MLNNLEQLPVDPILGLAAIARADANPNKVDLTVGVYMDDQGLCPVFEAVQRAQRALDEEEVTKAYLPSAGDDVFLRSFANLISQQKYARVVMPREFDCL